MRWRPLVALKESGYGREGSKYGMDDYMDIKYICMGGIDQVANSTENKK